MAGIATLSIKLDVTGIGDEITLENSIAMTVPVEKITGYTIVDTATITAIQLFTDITKIALAKTYGVYIKAQVGTIYIILNTVDTTTFTSTTADLVLNVGEACYLPINPAANLGLKIDGSAVTAAFSYCILGKA
jgi:hypothetical protein